jgi:hypothetical protein
MIEHPALYTSLLVWLQVPPPDTCCKCRQRKLWSVLAHVAALLQQPLLPVQDMVLHLAEVPPRDVGLETGCHLLLYVRCCLALQLYPGGDVAPKSKEVFGGLEAAQMASLAFLLWPDVAFFQRQAPNAVLIGLQVCLLRLHSVCVAVPPSVRRCFLVCHQTRHLLLL